MHSSSLVSVLCAVGAMAGPVINERNVARHQHNHMDFHKHAGRDTGAEDMLNFLESAAPAGDFPPESSGTPDQPSPEVKDVVVTAPTVFFTTTVGGGAPAPPASTSTSVPAVVKPPTNPAVHEKISGPPVGQNQPQPPPAAESSSAPPAANTGSASGMPSAPSAFDASLTSDDQAYKDLTILHHNVHRANHSLPALEWNETLYETAKATAQTCVWGHTQPTPPYGQNIAAGNAPGNVSADITNGFYNNEIGLFQQAIGEFGNNSPDMSDFEHWGHATQMLWKTTTSFGCYTAACAPAGADPLQCGPNGPYLQGQPCGDAGNGVRAFFLVCDYYPPGNYPDSYSAVPGPTGAQPFVQMTGNGVVGLTASD